MQALATMAQKDNGPAMSSEKKMICSTCERNQKCLLCNQCDAPTCRLCRLTHFESHEDEGQDQLNEDWHNYNEMVAESLQASSMKGLSLVR